MAPMALSDSKVTNDKSCSKSCLKNYEDIKKQYDGLLVKLDDIGFKAFTYKRGHKDYLMGLLKTELEKVKEEKEGFEFKIAKFEKSSKDLDDLLASLEEFKQHEVNEYGPRDSSLKPSTVCDKESDNSKENTMMRKKLSLSLRSPKEDDVEDPSKQGRKNEIDEDHFSSEDEWLRGGKRGLLGIKHFRVSSASDELVLLRTVSILEQTTIEETYTAGYRVILMVQVYCMLGEVNAAESLLVVSTKVNAD
ncbi:hypothetical protein Tco_0422616 [Tanacetum coccineum]